MSSWFGTSSKKPDFDEEALKLFKKLNLDPSGDASKSFGSRRYNNLDPVWRHPKTGAIVFVGNRTAASSAKILAENGVTRVVNCTDNMPNFLEGKGKVKYFRFVIYRYFSELDLKSTRGVFEFFEPVFNYVDKQVEAGHSVMIHCLAGAHRAGTTGTAYVMHAAKMYDHKEAIKACKTCRHVIDPIHGMKNLLDLLGQAMQKRADRKAKGLSEKEGTVERVVSDVRDAIRSLR